MADLTHGTRRRDTLARWLVPSLICVVASVQITLAHGWNLTPWKGGGFGMFASIDRLERRPVQVTVHTSEGEWIVDPQALLDDVIRYKRIQSLPDQRTLRRLATRVAAATWYAPLDLAEDAPRIAVATPPPRAEDAPEPTPLTVERVSIRVARMVYSRHTDELTLRTLSTFEAQADEVAP